MDCWIRKLFFNCFFFYYFTYGNYINFIFVCLRFQNLTEYLYSLSCAPTDWFNKGKNKFRSLSVVLFLKPQTR